MIRPIPVFSATSLILLVAACTPYKSAGAPCSFADRSACGEVAPINLDSPPATSGVRNASVSDRFDLKHAIAAADAAEAARDVPQGSAGVEPNVIILGLDEDDLTLEQADAELDRDLAFRNAIADDVRKEFERAIEKERAAAALREASLKGDMQALRQELAAAMQPKPLGSSRQRAVPKVAAPTTNHVHSEISTKQTPRVGPATLRDPDTAADGPESKERPALMAGRPVNKALPKTEPGEQRASSDVQSTGTGRQSRRERAAKALLATLTPNSGGSAPRDPIVDQELSKYRTFERYQEAVKNTEFSRQVRQTYVELATNESENGPYTKLLERLGPLPTDEELRAQYGVPANWVPE